MTHDAFLQASLELPDVGSVRLIDAHDLAAGLPSPPRAARSQSPWRDGGLIEALVEARRRAAQRLRYARAGNGAPPPDNRSVNEGILLPGRWRVVPPLHPNGPCKPWSRLLLWLREVWKKA